MFIPIGDGPTIGAEQAAQIVDRIQPRWVLPMHYRTARIGFLETEEAFVERMPNVQRMSRPSFDTGELDGERPLVVVPAAP